MSSKLLANDTPQPAQLRPEDGYRQISKGRVRPGEIWAGITQDPGMK